MKAYELALFLLILNATIGMVDSIGIFEAATIVDDPNIRIDDMQNIKINDEGIIEYDEDISLLAAAKTMLGVFVMGILGVVFVAPVLMSKFGVPLVLVAVLQVGIYLIYAAGIYQLITGRSIKNYE